MAKKAGSEKGKEGGESIQGYFRRILEANPELLEGRSNEELFKRWTADHGGYGDIPHAVKVGLQNAKSSLRSQGRKRKARKAARAAAARGTHQQPAVGMRSKQPLEGLEELIDECLTVAKTTDREGLESVIHLLRRARNEVVWKMGQ